MLCRITEKGTRCCSRCVHCAEGLGILALFCVLMTVNADEDESEDSLGMIRCMVRDNRRK
jgi:hypothetical protein